MMWRVHALCLTSTIVQYVFLHASRVNHDQFVGGASHLPLRCLEDSRHLVCVLILGLGQMARTLPQERLALRRS